MFNLWSFSFLPKFIQEINPDHHLSLSETYLNTFIQSLFGIPGSAAGYYLIDTRIGRKGTLALSSVGVGLSLFLFTFTTNPSWQLAFTCISSFLSNLIYGVVYSYTPEVFPTAYRGSAVGIAKSLSHVFAVMGPFLSAWLMSINLKLALYVSAGLFVSLGAFAMLLPRETRGVAAL